MANSTAYGFVAIKDLMAERINQVGTAVVQTAIVESIAEYTREIDALFGAMVQVTTEYTKRIQLPGAGTLQPLDQWGNPMPVQPSGNYNIALPIQGGGTAWGDNRISRAKMTVADANRFAWDVMGRDMDWLVRHLLAAWFTNTTWTYDDEEHGSLTVQPLANGDTVVYTRKGGTVATDNHFLAQANPIADADNPYIAIYDELTEHPANSRHVVAFIATNLKAPTKALTDFVPVRDPRIQAGANSDTLVGDIDPLFGDEALGRVSSVDVVEWKRLPDNYILFIDADAAEPAFAMREHAEGELRGLFPEYQDVDGNRQLHKFIRYAGFGAWNRVAAGVMKIGAGAYSVPAGFVAPLAV